MPDASMPHSSGPEVGEELTEGRAVCERCRRPKADVLRGYTMAECAASISPVHAAECDRRLLAERDDLAEAGDRLTDVLAAAILLIHGPDREDALDALARWRSLRSPKGAGNGN